MNVGALVAALDAAVTAAGVAFGSSKKPADATTRYVVADFDSGRVEDSSLRARDGWTATGTFRCYGQTDLAAWHADEILKVAILSLRGTTVDDRVLGMPLQLDAVPIQRDDDTSPPLYAAMSVWRFPTTQA